METAINEIIETSFVPENKIFIVPEYYRDYVTTLFWEGTKIAEVLDENNNYQ